MTALLLAVWVVVFAVCVRSASVGLSQVIAVVRSGGHATGLGTAAVRRLWLTAVCLAVLALLPALCSALA